MSFIKAVRGDEPPRPVQDVPLPAAGAWEATPYATKALNEEVARILGAHNGTRNDTLNRAALNMGQLIAGGQIPEPQVSQALYAAGLEAGLTDRETRATIRSGYAKGRERPRAATTQVRQNPLPHTEDDLNTYLDWETAYMDQKDVEWLCEPFIPAGRLVALYSPPKVGKSLLALEIAAAIARGGEVLGNPTTQAVVLYLDYENAVQDVVSRLKAMGRNPRDLANLKYWSFPMAPPLDTAAGGELLLNHATQIGARLVVIDTISRCISGDENDASTWLNLYRHTLLPLKGAGISVLRLDHTGKDETRGQRGSSAKSGDVDLVWRLSELLKGRQYVLECESHRIQMHETLLNIERTSDPLAHRVDTRSIGETKALAILTACDAAGLPISAGRDQIRKVIDAAGLKASNGFLAELTRRRQNQVDLS